MPARGWKSEVIRFLSLLAVAGLIGLVLGLFKESLLLAALAYSLWSLRQLRRLNDWLLRADKSEPPEATGLWGQVFDTLSQVQRDTERANARLLANIEHLRASFGSMSDAVVMLDPEGAIEWSNPAANTLLGLRNPDDNGRHLVNLIRMPDFIRYFESGDYQERLIMRSPVNEQIHLSVSVSVFGREHRLLFARDITRTRQLEQMRKDFVANVSHELRTPLTVINGYLEMLSAQPELAAPMARALQQMGEQSQRMQTLINDLMTLSRLEAVPAVRQPDIIAMKPLMSTLREDILLAARGERTVAVECDETRQLLGDSQEIRSAFSNLAMNAARYTNDGDRIVLRWYVDRDHGYFQVEDTGIGIEPQHLPRLTERFYRVDGSRATATGGTGLGLAIVKHVLLRHKGELRIHSVPDKGSTFTCVFPLTAVKSGKTVTSL